MTKPKYIPSDWWQENNFNLDIFVNFDDFVTAIERALDKNQMLILYAIDSDLLIYGICTKIRESKYRKLLIQWDDKLEEYVAKALGNIMQNTFFIKKEHKKLWEFILGKIHFIVKDNPSQEIMEM